MKGGNLNRLPSLLPSATYRHSTIVASFSTICSFTFDYLMSHVEPPLSLKPCTSTFNYLVVSLSQIDLFSCERTRGPHIWWCRRRLSSKRNGLKDSEIRMTWHVHARTSFACWNTIERIIIRRPGDTDRIELFDVPGRIIRFFSMIISVFNLFVKLLLLSSCRHPQRHAYLQLVAANKLSKHARKAHPLHKLSKMVLVVKNHI